jgi:hypothetical protein
MNPTEDRSPKGRGMAERDCRSRDDEERCVKGCNAWHPLTVVEKGDAAKTGFRLWDENPMQMTMGLAF